MDIASFAIGLLGVFFAVLTHLRSRKTEFMVRVNLAAMSSKAQQIQAYAGWSCDHFWTIRKCFDGSEWSQADRRQMSEAIQAGGGDALATNRMVHELLRDIRSLQLATFGQVQDLKSNGILVSLPLTEVSAEPDSDHSQKIPGL